MSGGGEAGVVRNSGYVMIGGASRYGCATGCDGGAAVCDEMIGASCDMDC
jgi:hypothetical protein